MTEQQLDKITQKALEDLSRERTSAWNRGLAEYIREIAKEAARVYNFKELNNYQDFKKCLLHGAQDWQQYAYGGSSLIYDEDICNRLCTKSEKRRFKNGLLDPAKNKLWMDIQARALWQAAQYLQNAYWEV